CSIWSRVMLSVVVGICVGNDVGWPPVIVTMPRSRTGGDEWSACAAKLKGKAVASATATRVAVMVLLQRTKGTRHAPGALSGSQESRRPARRQGRGRERRNACRRHQLHDVAKQWRKRHFGMQHRGRRIEPRAQRAIERVGRGLRSGI